MLSKSSLGLAFSIWIVLWCGIVPAVALGQGKAEALAEQNRGHILNKIGEMKAVFKKDPKNADARLRYGKLLYQAGEFWQAKAVVRPLVEGSRGSAEALSLAAELAYLTGYYGEAEKLYERIIDANIGSGVARTEAKMNLMFTYYQTNQFDKVKKLSFPAGVKLPYVDLINTFEENPYKIEWQNEQRESVVLFLMTDPLPVMTVEFNGVPAHMLFDTGGDMFILDSEIAEGMGVKSVAKAMGTFAAGKQSEVEFGKVDSVKVGKVMLKNVPVMIMPTKRFSAGFEGGKYTLGGVIGTAALRQFLSTIDYKNGRLILRERTDKSRRKLLAELNGRIAAEIPFVLKMTHCMMARGRLNDKDGLTFFVDSGLDSEAAVSVPIQTLNYLGIAAPERKIDPNDVGGGGGVYPSGLFPVQTLGLGPLVQENVKGEYGSFSPAGYWGNGFITDALISHQFLRRYSSWTLDFSQMKYIFEK